MIKNKKYGLIGKNIAYSFSKRYFTEKFKNLDLNKCTYDNFDLLTIEDFPSLYNSLIDKIHGLNVTIPYKEEIIKYLDEIDENADAIGAVNTIKILKNNKIKGYNTDIYGFENSLIPLLGSHIKKCIDFRNRGCFQSDCLCSCKKQY